MVELKYIPIEDYPDKLKKMGLRPVFIPKQDGHLMHYALIDNKEREAFSGDNSLINFASETWRIIGLYKHYNKS